MNYLGQSTARWGCPAKLRRGRLGVTTLLAVLLVASTTACGGTSEAPSAKAENLPSSKLISAVVDAGEIRVGMAPAAPWLILDPETKRYIGPAATLAEKIGERLGVKVSYVPVTFDSFVAAIQSGQVDLVAAPLSVTPERQKAVSMVPWSGDGVCFLAKKTSSLTTLDDLKRDGVKFGVGQGTLGLSVVKDEFPRGKTVSRALAPGEQMLYPEVKSGAADVALVNGTQGQVYLAKYKDLKLIPADCPGTVVAKTDVAVAFGPNDKGMSQIVGEVVDANRSLLDSEFKKFSQADFMNKYS